MVSNLHLAGRLASYRYFDMYQATAQALTLALTSLVSLLPSFLDS